MTPSKLRPCHFSVLAHQKDRKFIATACGSKHTIALDYEGNVWFWGSKRAIGQLDFVNENQLEPILILGPQEGGPFKFVAAGANHNMVISKKGEVFGFGGNEFHKINASNEVVLQPVKVQLENVEKICTYVSCGFNHSCLVTAKGHPYTWGNTSNGRCGVRAEMQETNTGKVEATFAAPHLVRSLAEELKRERQNLERLLQNENINLGQDEEEKGGDFNQVVPRFKVQRLLKANRSLCNDENLINADHNLHTRLNLITEKLHETLNKLQHLFNVEFYRSEQNIVSRIYTFPIKVPYLNDLKAALPKGMAQKKEVYEKLISYLQLHPCYLLRIIYSAQKSQTDMVY